MCSISIKVELVFTRLKLTVKESTYYNLKSLQIELSFAIIVHRFVIPPLPKNIPLSYYRGKYGKKSGGSYQLVEKYQLAFILPYLL